MNHLKIIHEFLTQRQKLPELYKYGFPFVTISRQAGAGGHVLAYALKSEFDKSPSEPMLEGWHVFDKQLCEVVAEDPLLRDSMGALLTETYHSEFKDFVESLFTGRSRQYLVHKSTFKVVHMLAAIGKVIVVGRGGVCVGRSLPLGVHVRLVAPEAQRIVWMMKRFKLTKDAAREAMVKQDDDRRKLMKTYFNRDIDDPLLYDVVWNTGLVDLSHIVESVMRLLRDRYAVARKASKRDNR